MYIVLRKITTLICFLMQISSVVSAAVVGFEPMRVVMARYKHVLDSSVKEPSNCLHGLFAMPNMDTFVY